MADEALNATLDELRALRDEDDEAPRRSPSPATRPEPRSTVGGSLLDELLSETTDQARREVEDIKLQLQAKQEAQLQAKRRAQDVRRKELDEARRQELARHESFIRRRERRLRGEPETEPEQAAVAAPVPPAPAKSSGSAIAYAVLGLLVLGGAGFAVYHFVFSESPDPIAVKETALAGNGASPGAPPEPRAPEKTVAPPTAPAAAKPAPVVAAPPVIEPRVAEFEEMPRHERRPFEFKAGNAGVTPEDALLSRVKKHGAKKGHRGGTSHKARDNGGKIKLRKNFTGIR